MAWEAACGGFPGRSLFIRRSPTLAESSGPPAPVSGHSRHSLSLFLIYQDLQGLRMALRVSWRLTVLPLAWGYRWSATVASRGRDGPDVTAAVPLALPFLSPVTGRPDRPRSSP